MTKLKEHRQKKADRVKSWDIIATGLNVAGWLLLVVSFMQPKNPINIAQLSIAFGLFSVSVGAERLRESDLLLLNSATKYEENIINDRVMLDTVINEELYKLKTIEEMFIQFPSDRHLEIAQKIGAAPPNYAARQLDPIVQSLHQPIQAPMVTDDADPTGDFDPEVQPEQREDSGSRFIMASNVDEWFKEMGDRAPQSLVDQWLQCPGAGIEITNGQASVVPKKGN